MTTRSEDIACMIETIEGNNCEPEIDHNRKMKRIGKMKQLGKRKNGYHKKKDPNEHL
jgi:hypothetical protein